MAIPVTVTFFLLMNLECHSLHFPKKEIKDEFKKCLLINHLHKLLSLDDFKDEYSKDPVK